MEQISPAPEPLPTTEILDVSGSSVCRVERSVRSSGEVSAYNLPTPNFRLDVLAGGQATQRGGAEDVFVSLSFQILAQTRARWKIVHARQQITAIRNKFTKTPFIPATGNARTMQHVHGQWHNDVNAPSVTAQSVLAVGSLGEQRIRVYWCTQSTLRSFSQND